MFMSTSLQPPRVFNRTAAGCDRQRSLKTMTRKTNHNPCCGIFKRTASEKKSQDVPHYTFNVQL